MKTILLLSALAATFLMATARFERVTPPTYINRPTLPPHDRHRFRREANPQDHGSISATVEKSMSGFESRPSYRFDYQHNIWKGKNGEITTGVGASKMPGERWDPHVGIQGTYRWKREPCFECPLDAMKFDYEHNIFKNDNAQFGTSIHGYRLPTMDWAANLGAQGSYKLGHGLFSGGVTQPFSTPEQRPTFDLHYQHSIFNNDNAQIGAGIAALKTSGHDWAASTGAKGSYQLGKGLLSGGVTQPLNGPEKRPSYDFNYEHSILGNKNAQINAGINGQKSPGQDWALNAKAQGSYKMGDGQLSAGVTKPLNGPEKSPTYNVDYQHDIWKGKNGQVTAGVGVDKSPGQNLDTHASVQATIKLPN